MVEARLRPPTQEELDYAIYLGSKVVIPTIKLLRGHFRKKSIEIRLVYGAVFTLYDSISIEEYNDIFVKKVLGSKKDKHKLEIDGLTVNYFISPNIKVASLVPLEAEYGIGLLEEEILSMSTRIDQIRLLMFPMQEQEMSPDGLTSFAKAFDNFIENLEICLRQEKKLPLKILVTS